MSIQSTETRQAMNEERIAIKTTYFNKVDNGDPTFMELFTDDVRFFFPKSRVIKGKKS